MHKSKSVWLALVVSLSLVDYSATVTMKQFEASLDMMRNGCMGKFKLSKEQLDGLRQGQFDDDNKDLRCYTRCVAQLAGGLTKKGELSYQKTAAQIPILIPPEIQEAAKKALDACIDTQKKYPDSCDKVYYTTKCSQEFDPVNFKFP